MKLPVHVFAQGIVVSLYVQPGASVSGWAGLQGEALKLKVKARPVDGEANLAVVQYLASFFAVPKSSVTIMRGFTGRNKTVSIEGVSEELIARARTIPGNSANVGRDI